MHSQGHPAPHSPCAWCLQLCLPSCHHHHHPLPPRHSCLLLWDRTAAGIKAPVPVGQGDGDRDGTQGDPRRLGTCPCCGLSVTVQEGAAPKQWGQSPGAMAPLYPSQPGRGPWNHSTMPSNPICCWWWGWRQRSPQGHPTEWWEERVPSAPLG